MSEIIECPACSTRYKLNKPIPEGGRHVKCARCGHQWRMVPEETAAEEELEMLSPEEEDGMADQQAPEPQTAQPREHHDVFARHSPAGDPVARSGPDADARAAEPEGGAATEPQDDFSEGSRIAAAADEDGPGRGGWSPEMDSDAQRPGTDPFEGDEDEYRPEDNDARFGASTSTVGWQARREHYASAISTLSEPDLSDFRDDEKSDDAERDRQDFQDHLRANEPWDFDEWADDPSADRATSASREEGRFRSVPQPPPESAKPEKRASWASRLMPFKRSRTEAREPQADDEADLGETEFEIREALNAALERPTLASDTDIEDDHEKREEADTLAGKPAQGQTESAPHAADQERVRFPEAAAPEDDDGKKSFSDDFSDFSFGGRGPDEDETDAEDQDPPFRLSGDNARRPIYGAQKDSLDETNPFEERRRDADAFEDQFDDAFAPDWDGEDGNDRRDRRASGARAEGAFEDDFSSLYDRQFKEDADRDPGQAVDEDFEALRSELESTDITSYEREGKSSGGLAVVAAWAVFISIFSGALFGLISFRQDIMTALPGTTSLYAGLGFETENSGIDFADVSYRWTTADGKPMIEVTGQVVNVTDRTVKVPQVVVNVRDTGGSNAVQAKASVPARELAPRQRASFSLEFLSPPENVAQIELELDRSRN